MLPTNDKDRKALPILTFLTQYFPDVWPALTRVCVAGNVQHNPELAPTDIKWAREKSKDQLNTAFRHLFDRACGVQFDTDGQYHLAKAIWRLSAQLQLDIENRRAAPLYGPNDTVDGMTTMHPSSVQEFVIASATLEEVRRMASAGAPLIAEPAMTYPPRSMDPEGAINADAYAEDFKQTPEFKTWPYAEPEHPSCEKHGLTICKVCMFPSGTNR